MGSLDIAKAKVGNMTENVDDFSVSAEQTDSATGQGETEFIHDKWNDYLGYFQSIPELAAAINAIARWTIGRGIDASPETLIQLSVIRGFGKDNINTILENMIRTYYIIGDAFAEIVRDGEGNLINIKPLDPSTIKIICSNKGIITRYEQIAKVDESKTTIKYQPDDIFHLCKNRIADEIHGTGLVRVLEEIILSRNEAMKDMKILMHRYVTPRIVWRLDTQDENKINEFIAKADKGTKDAENLFIPKEAAEWDILAIPQNATMSPLPWIEALNKYFYQGTGGTDIVIGATGDLTEATSKMKYLAYEQNVAEEQTNLMEECANQLNIEIELEFPASLQNELLSDKQKDRGSMQIQQNEVQTDIRGRT